MITILDIQHAGRASRPSDMGAAYDLDGDGHVGEAGEREVDLVRGYVEAARSALTRCGHTVAVLTDGEYGTRHAEAIRLAKTANKAVYLACHVNAGRGRYALVRPDSRSTGGARFARTLLRHLEGVAELPTGKLWPMGPTDRGWSCIDGIYDGPAWLCGVLVEPGFIDSPQHRRLWTPAGLVEVGTAIAAACHEWARS